MTTKATFWMVYCPQGPYPPSVQHPSEYLAVTEAERLASLNPGKEFFVLRGIGMAKKVSVQYLELAAPEFEEVPF